MRSLFRGFKRRWVGLSRRRKILSLIGVGVLAMLAGGYVWLFADLPSVYEIRAGFALPSTRIYDRHGRLLYEIISNTETGGRNRALTLAEIPLHCQQAVISVEDTHFYAHPGVDVNGVLRALWINVQGGEVIAGGSTITQQVARNLLFDPEQRAERSLHRKLREMILALQLQSIYDKDAVLAMYLNQSYFGNLAYGIDAAARAYFGKLPAELSLAECALLAGLVQSPALYDPLTNPQAALARQSIVLDLMVRDGYITGTQAEAARIEPLNFSSVPFSIQAPHFVMAVIKQLERLYAEEMYRDGLEVITTVDLDWQNAAQTVVQQALTGLNNRAVSANANNAALVSINPLTGEVLAMLGSPNYFDETIDGAVNAALAFRQPGSTLKPFTYAVALDPTRETPWTPSTMLLDIETPFVTRRLESYTPLNFGLVEHGPTSLREALASSFNIPAVVALEHVGIGPMIQLASNAGMTNLANNPELDLSVTLGGGEVRLLDLTQAYASFANGGYRVEPVFILNVTDQNGQVLYNYQPQAPSLRIMDERVAYLITDILSDDFARIAGFGRYSALNIGRPVAAKTGTTTDYRDNWIVGYTPELVTGVWVGNADNQPMQNVTGVSGAAPIWNQYMRAVLRGVPISQFIEPEGLVHMTVCEPSGLLPTQYCQRTRAEVFIDGTQPTLPDNIYQPFIIDRTTGLLADENTLPEDRVERVYMVLPQEARDWGLANNIARPPANTVVQLNERDDQLRFLDPDPYTVFQISPTIPLSAQRVRFSVGVTPFTQQVQYELDGVPVGEVDASPWTLWWQLEAGEHSLVAHALLEDGTRVSTPPITFRVLTYEQAQAEFVNQ